MIAALLLSAALAAPLPVPSAGRIERLALASAHVPARPVDVWLPPGYPAAAPYAVLYLHDGQMLFDAGITWNRQEWRVDEVAAALQAAGEVRPFIVVGVWNAGDGRHAEYFPAPAYARLGEAERAALHAIERTPGQPLLPGPPTSREHLRFLVEDVRPAVNARFAVSTTPEDTVVGGSSMGGLAALHALMAHPDVFGGVAALSTHWPGALPREHGALPEALLAHLAADLPAAGRHRLYFDLGTATLDAAYPPLQARADAIVRGKGYGPGDWTTRVFEGAEHTEQAWSERLDQPLRFLLPPRRAGD